MKIISVEVDEELAKVLEAIEQPYLDRPTLIKNLLFSGLKQYRIELAIKIYSKNHLLNQGEKVERMEEIR